MPNTTLNSRLILRNDTASTWINANPVLLKGETGVENDTKKFKFGDGTTAWNSLPYASTMSAHISNSAPLSTDIKYDLGTLWLNTSDSSVYTLMAISTTAVWTKIVTTTELVNALTAYMQISTYDSNGDGSVDKADKLKTARTVSLTGDATGSTSFDGSVDKAIALTLTNSGVTAGTYTKVTVDAKGRVTVGNGLAAADIPTLTLSKISGAGTAASKDVAETGDATISQVVLGSDSRLSDSRPANGGNADTVDGKHSTDFATAAQGTKADSAVQDSLYVHTDNNYTTADKTKLNSIDAGANNYSLPKASATVLGGIKVGENLSVDADGVLSAQAGAADMQKSIYDPANGGKQVAFADEVYTKSESNARFTGALIVKESGNPITVYPDATGAPLTAISQRGKTTQPGTGDPSPTNIRPIYGVGQYDLNIVFTGSENWAKSGSNILCFTNAYPDASNSAVCTDFKVLVDVGGNGIYAMIQSAKCVGFAFGSNSGFNTSDEVKEFFTSRYNKGTPVRFICKSTTYSTATQVYIGFSVTDANGYHGYAAGPTAPLYEGDTLTWSGGNTVEVVRKTGTIALNVSNMNNTDSFPGWASSGIKNLIGADLNTVVTGAVANFSKLVRANTTGTKDLLCFSTVDVGGLTQTQLKAQYPDLTFFAVIPLATPTTETAPISEPITNAAGPITIAAENTVDVTYNKSLAKAFEQITAAIASLGTV